MVDLAALHDYSRPALTTPSHPELAPSPSPAPSPAGPSGSDSPFALRVGGGAVFAIAVTAMFLMMASARQLAHGPLFGIIACVIAIAGLLAALGVLRPSDAAAVKPIRDSSWFAKEGEPFWMAPIVTGPLAALVVLVGGFILGFEHVRYAFYAAFLILFMSAMRRPALVAFVIAGVILFPSLANYGLWDPWETHYGEVSREILSRDDWLSLWWAQEDWFWSKPILIFWSEALSMGALGVDFHPDANPAHPEFAVRLPIALMALGALMSVYFATSRYFGARAGIFAVAVLATIPHFFLLARQAVTDMPVIANMTIAVSLIALAFAEEDHERPPTGYRIGPFVLSGRALLIGGFVAVALPQILYLVTRNVTLDTSEGIAFSWHVDRFIFGSAGNAGVPGNPAITERGAWEPSFYLQPAAQGLYWLIGASLAVWLMLREHRVRHLYLFGFYLFCGLAFMGKGIPGLALPGIALFFLLIATGRFREVLEGHFRVCAGLLTLFVVSLPWFVAMYLRHGPAFTDRLLVHDHLNRLAAGVHGDNGSMEYFLEQLGPALFPWVGLVPVALTAWVWYARRESPLDATFARRRDYIMLQTIWFISSFTLFSAMVTKFHHYIAPVVVPAGILTGILLDHLAERISFDTKKVRAYGAIALSLVAPILLVLGVGGLRGNLRGVAPEDVPLVDASDWIMAEKLPVALSIVIIILALVAFAGAVLWMRSSDDSQPDAGVSSSNGKAIYITVSTIAIAAACLVAFVGRDLAWRTCSNEGESCIPNRPAGYERLIHLFVYNYPRPWPEQFDYRPILTGFAVTATLFVLFLAWKKLRTPAIHSLLGLGFAFAIWTLDVYIIDLSPHWGQRELVKKYYELRSGTEEPLVAYQMNWKGENFYTGNHVSVFVDLDTTPLKEWANERRGQRAFFLLEHSRVGGLRSALGRDRVIREETDKRFCNKFILVSTTL